MKAPIIQLMYGKQIDRNEGRLTKRIRIVNGVKKKKQREVT